MHPKQSRSRALAVELPPNAIDRISGLSRNNGLATFHTSALGAGSDGQPCRELDLLKDSVVPVKLKDPLREDCLPGAWFEPVSPCRQGWG